MTWWGIWILSSVGQSIRFITGRSSVRIRENPLNVLRCPSGPGSFYYYTLMESTPPYFIRV